MATTTQTTLHLPVVRDVAEPAARAELVPLAEALAARVAGEVRFDTGSRALYATDGSNYRQVPIGVVLPQSADDVLATIETCRERGVPILSRGGGTSLAGQCCNVAVVMDFSKHMRRIVELAPTARRARVEPGLVLDVLRDAAEEHHLTFAPDPSTHNRCTLGGMIGNNSCGVHSVMGGKTVENVHALDVVTYDGVRMTVGPASEDEIDRIVREGGRRGEIYRRLRALRDRYAPLIRARYPNIPRRVSGYNLDQLLPENGFHVARALVGSEGTCVTVLEATLRLVHSPPFRTLVVLGYDDVYRAADAVPEIMQHGPIGLEGIDERLVEDMKKKHIHPGDLHLLPEGRGWLLVEVGGESRREADEKGRAIIAAVGHAAHAKLYDDREEEHTVWRVRESGLGATARVPGAKDTWEGWEDSAVPPERLGEYLRAFDGLLAKYGYHGALYGHFGQGCLHTRIDWDPRTREGQEKWRRFAREAAHLVVSLGGSLSGEHGDGQSRAELLPIMFGEELVQAFREFKAIWDPDGKMNPGKIVDAYRIDENLRLGVEQHHPKRVETYFRYADDQGSFERATERCVGVGECRKTKGGTMCPSYMATREEMHSTRGRTHLLFEMLQGDPLEDGWRSPHVREALDLCLACKSCKTECPLNVDMATYKAEFLAHYYQGRMRPPGAYAFGMMDRWARVASIAPWLANFMTQTKGLSAIAKAAIGVSKYRTIPRFARRTFLDWFRARARPHQALTRPRVILWPDTWSNHFQPDVAISAVLALEALGFRVDVPRGHVCCGRPLYDYGMLRRARSLLQRTIDVLRDDIRAGVPVVGLEPSCVSVFRDELCELLPDDPDAGRLAEQSLLLSELLVKHDVTLPRVQGRAVVQGHCHHKSLLKIDDEKKVLERLGLDFEVLDSGCCGMAGAFGYEKHKYDVSIACGERVLLPAVRAAPRDALIVADGFSCREQIAQETDRRPLHLSHVLALATGARGHVG